MPEPTKKTPYQGRRRCFGAFECTSCQQEWFSANSWANYGQECNRCRAVVYPHAQWPLKKSKRKTHKGKPHPMELCGKCNALGYNCCSYSQRTETSS